MRVKLRGQNHSVYAVANGNVLLFKLYGGSVSQLGACRCDDESKTKGHHDQRKKNNNKKNDQMRRIHLARPHLYGNEIFNEIVVHLSDELKKRGKKWEMLSILTQKTFIPWMANDKFDNLKITYFSNGNGLGRSQSISMYKYG